MRILLFLLILTTAYSTAASSQELLGSLHYLSEQHLSATESDSPSLLLADARTNSSARWQQSPSSAISLDFKTSAHWFYWSIDVATLQNPIFRVNNPIIDELDIWFFTDDGQIISHHQGGLLTPFVERELADIGFSYVVSPKAKHILLRAKSSSALYIDVSALSTKTYISYRLIDALSFGLFCGLILTMLLYNIYLSFQNELSYMTSYCFWIASLWINQITVTGFSNQYLWPTAPWLNQPLSIISSFTLCLFGSYFMYQLLNLKKHYPWLVNQFFKLYMGVGMVLLLVTNLNVFEHPTSIVYLYIYLSVTITVCSSVWRAWCKDYNALWLLLAWMCVILPGVGRIIILVGGASGSYLMDVLLFVGTSSETLLIALLLANILHKVERDKLKISEDLVQAETLVNKKLQAEVNEKTRHANRLHRQLRLAQYKDSITQLANQHYFYQKLNRLITAQQGSFEAYTLLLIQLDNVNQIVFEHDEDCYDFVLKHTGKILKQECKSKKAVLARHSGEYFMVLYPNVSIRDTITHCKHLKQQLRDNKVHCGHNPITLSSSIAGLSFTMNNSLTLQQIIDRTEALMAEFSLKGPDQLKIDVLESDANKVSSIMI